MAEPRPADPGTVDFDNPWPGLASFREADRELFFGREIETQEILRLALRERLTVLFGLSGLGKTSLLRAGLFPLLRQENILPVYLRLDFSEAEGARRTLTGQVRQEIAREATEAGIEVPASTEGETLWESLHRQGAELWSPRNRIVTPLLVFDQFEEVFTLGRRNAARAQEAEAFLTELADLCEGSVPAALRERLEADPAATREFSFSRHPYKILLSLREDFLPELEGLRGRIRSIVHNRFRLRRMNGDNALRVVTQAGGHLVEPDVPERIVRFVAGQEIDSEVSLAELEIEPALLSVVCRELNNKRRAQGLPRITADLVRGNRDEILSGLYERSVDDLGPDVRSFIEERLLTKSGFRDSVALENAVETPGVTREALDKLTDRRLLRIEDRGGMQRLELTHDVLTGVIRKSRDQRREREAERKLRRSRLALALLALVLLGVAAFAAWGFKAQRTASKALASSDVARASTLRDSNPGQALAYLARAIREEPESVPAQNMLADLLLYRSWPRPVRELRHGDAEWVELSDDGHLFVTVSKSGEEIRIWDTQTLREVGEVRQSDAINSIEISRDGRRLLIVSPGTAQLWDTQTRKSLWRTDLEQEAIPRLSPDGRWLAWIRDQKTLGIRDNNTRRQHAIITPLLVKFGFSPDSRRIFAADFMDKVFLWDVESGRSLPAPRASAMADVVFSPDSRHLLVTGFQTTLWDLEKQTETQVGETGRTRVRGWLSPGGEKAALQVSEELWVWNIGTDSLLATIPKRDLIDAEFSRDGRRLLTTSEEGVELWDAGTGLPVSQALCECLHGRFLPGSRQIVTGDDSGVLRLWRAEPIQTGTELYRAAGSTRLFSSFSLDGRRLAIRTADGKVQLWDTDAVRPLGAPIDDTVSHQLALSPDGRFLYEIRRVLHGHREDALQIWDTQTGRPARPLFHLPDKIWDHGYRANPADEILALKSEDDTVQLWSLSTGKLLGATQQKQRITKFDFTPGGDLVTTSANGLFTWDSRTGGSLGPAISHESPVTSFDFSLDGKLLVTGTEYGLVRIWDLRSNPARMLVGPLRHRDKIDSVRFELGDRILLTRATNFLRLWDTRTGEPKSASLRAEGETRSAQLGPGGARILVNANEVDQRGHRLQENTVRLLDARTGQPFVKASFASDVQAQLSSTGQILWVASQNEGIHIFVVPHFPKQDRKLLARWAEAVGGWTLDEEGRLVELSDQLSRLASLRRETADAPPGQLGAASLIRWFLSDPKTRTVSPIFEKTIEPG